MKNNFCLFDLFGIFIFEISFFVSDILTVKYWIKNTSGNIEAVFLKLGTKRPKANATV